MWRQASPARLGEPRRTARELPREASMSTSKPEVDFPDGDPPSDLQITEIWEGNG